MTELGPALTLGQMVDRAAARVPDREAIVFKGERVTYRQLKRRADDFARGLLALGLGPGDHVVLWMPNCVEWNVANLGIAKIGAVTVTCNSRYKALEAAYVLRQSDARALIMVDPLRGRQRRLPRDLPRAMPRRRPVRVPRAAARGRARRGAAAGRLRVRRRRARGPRGSRGPPRYHRHPARRPGRDAVHLRDHRRAEGLPALPRQHVLQVPRLHGAARMDLRGPIPGAGALLPHLRLDGRGRGQLPRGVDAGGDGRLRPARGDAAHRGRARHDLLGGADDVHHRARPPRLRQARPALAADRLDRSRPRPGRDHAEDHRPRARARDGCAGRLRSHRGHRRDPLDALRRPDR